MTTPVALITGSLTGIGRASAGWMLPVIAAGFLLLKGSALPSVAGEFAAAIVLLALLSHLIPNTPGRI